MSLFGMNLFDEDNIDTSTAIFSSNYKCFSHNFSSSTDSKKEELSRGGKILLPATALEKLTNLNVSYPMLFKLTNSRNKRSTHCGVLEFTSENNQVILPYWMMQNIGIGEGEDIKVEYCNLPLGEFAKFKPLSTSFMGISNQKAVLENAFRGFACLTKGDVLSVYYNNTSYELLVTDLKPAGAVLIIECDLHFEFDAPDGYEEASSSTSQSQDSQAALKMKQDVEAFLKGASKFKAFSGQGKRIDGRRLNSKQKTVEEEDVLEGYKRGLPNYNWTFGELNFSRVENRDDNKTEEETFTAFSGQGQSIRKKAKL